MAEHLATFSLVTLHEVAPEVVPAQAVEALAPYAGSRTRLPTRTEAINKGCTSEQADEHVQRAEELGNPEVLRFVNDDGLTIERTTVGGRIVSERIVTSA